MKLRDKINEDLTHAMKARDALRLSVLRMMKTAVKNKEIDARAELDDAAVLQVFSTLIKQRMDSIDQFTRGGRVDLVEKETAELRIIETYLPAGVSDEEIATVVDEVVKASGATSPRDIGPVMKQCMARFAGKFVDGKKVNLQVKARLEKTP